MIEGNKKCKFCIKSDVCKYISKRDEINSKINAEYLKNLGIPSCMFPFNLSVHCSSFIHKDWISDKISPIVKGDKNK